jgi:cephalosporin hydroxylase
MSNFIDEFPKHYYNGFVWAYNTKWLGTPISKLPLDLFIYQEVIYELKADIIIETGTINCVRAFFFCIHAWILKKGKGYHSILL